MREQATQLKQGAQAMPNLAQVQAISKQLAQLELDEERRMGTLPSGRSEKTSSVCALM